jgi:hypothetical protein
MVSPRVIEYLYPAAVPLRDYALSDVGQGPYISSWNTATLGAQPTEAYLASVEASQAYFDWLAEHGGDVARTARRLAQEALDRSGVELEVLIRAVVIELLGHINTQLAQKHNDLLVWLGTQTALVNRNQLTNFQATQPTPAQARTAIKNRVSTGQADN